LGGAWSNALSCAEIISQQGRKRSSPLIASAPEVPAMRVLTAIGLCAGAAAAFAGPADDARQTASELRDGLLGGRGAAEIARNLSDRVGPRPAGSEGAGAARRWAVAELGRLGLRNVREEPLMEPHWVRGASAAEIVEPVRQRLVIAALGGSGGTPAEGLEGEVLAAENVAALEALAAKDPSIARGRIVFFTERMSRSRDGSGYSRAVAIRWGGAEAARKLGAAAVLIRSVGTSSTRLPHTGIMSVPSGVPALPAAALSGPDADLLERIVATERARVHLVLGCRTEPDVAGANVVGEIPGSSAPEEVVLIGAHLDSWDLGTGALDDAAGVGIVCEAARAIAALPRRPRRTIRVVLFADEESGGRGAAAYAAAHRAELDRHVAAFEMDFGTDRVYRVAASGGPEADGVLGAAAGLLSPLGIAAGGHDANGGSDVGGLRAFGVPLFDLDQDGSRYFDFHHSADDTADKLDGANLAQATAATAALAWLIADEPGTPGRIPPEKRKVESW
jgi:Zn-dependent M28 family amino/carboxypeptidase